MLHKALVDLKDLNDFDFVILRNGDLLQVEDKLASFVHSTNEWYFFIKFNNNKSFEYCVNGSIWGTSGDKFLDRDIVEIIKNPKELPLLEIVRQAVN